MPELILLIGIPGSGKSFYAKKYEYDRIFLHNTTILSSDQTRKELYGDENDQTHNEEVFQYIKDTSVEKLEKGQRVIIDATNSSRKARQSITDYVDQKLSFYEYGFIKFYSHFLPKVILNTTLLIWRFITYYLGMITGALLINFEKKGK